MVYKINLLYVSSFSKTPNQIFSKVSNGLVALIKPFKNMLGSFLSFLPLFFLIYLKSIHFCFNANSWKHQRAVAAFLVQLPILSAQDPANLHDSLCCRFLFGTAAHRRQPPRHLIDGTAMSSALPP